jgi:fimbrial isopeptide formation D2 family protein/uncharacterized repeat protein (TIGR01451 family)
MGATHRLDATCWRGGYARVISGLLLLLAALWVTPASAATGGTCGAAASQGANGPADYATYCWFDFSGYNNTTASSAGGQAFVITLTGGSTLSFTLKVTGPALTSTTVPTWTGAALGQSAFITIPGNPALYQTGGAGTTTVTLSNIVLSIGSGGTVPYAIVAADAESTNNGENLSFTTNGSAWTLLASMAYTGSTTFPTLAGVGTATVTETGVTGNVGAYAFATQGSPTTISSSFLGSGLQGIAFAVKFHAVDFAIASAHTGSFSAGGTGSYTLTATNNGPDQYAPTDTVTVTDTLPTGESYVSASGTGWTCGAVGQVVTCTASNVTVNSGSSLPAITLNVSVANTVASSVTNTVTVASNPNLDYNTANNTATDVTTIVEPDLTTSTKDVLNTTGGDYNVGDTVQYTITLTESAGAVAAGVGVTDNVPANLSGFTATSVTVTGSSTTITNSSTNTGGSNGDGLLSISNITVPASGAVTVIFTAQVKTGTANCAQINNTATITNPNGSTTSISATAPTVTVAQSACVIAGSKAIYPYDNLTMTRTAPTAAGAGDPINGNNITDTFSMSGLPLQEPLQINAGAATFKLIMARTGTATPAAQTSRTITATLETSTGTVIGTGNVTFTSATATLYTIAFTATATLVPAGEYLKLLINNNSANTTAHSVTVSQYSTALGASSVSFSAGTTANPLVFVKSVNVYNATYPATTTTTVYSPGTTVYVCAVVNDPFGSTDVGSSLITITDSNGSVLVSAAAMTENPPLPATPGKTNCDGTADKDVTNTYTLGNSYEYTYTIPPTGTAATGFWTATVTGNEGTEGVVSHTANAAFDVDVPSLLVVKSVLVSADTTGDTIKHSLPGATMQYTIQVQNNGRGPAANNTLVITDLVPANTGLSLPAKPPFTFTDGSTSSGLSVSANDGSIVYSNNGGTSYVYVPSCTRPCVDTAITNFRITLNGSMNGKTGGTAPSFSIVYNVVIQ